MRQRGIFEKVADSGEWWIRYSDATGRIRRKIGESALAYADRHKRSAGDDHVRMGKLFAWFGDRAADSITPREIETCFQEENWAPATWNRYRALLSLTYRLAIRAGSVKENLARFIQHKTENNGRVRFLSREEEEIL